MTEPTDVFTTMLHAVDDLDWDTVRACFSAEIDVDYTSLWGGDAETVPVEQLVSGWKELATGYDATQHLTGPFVVTHRDDRRLDCTTTFRAYHHVIEDGDASTWMVAGRYVIGLELESDRWRIKAVTLRLAYEEGDRRLVDLARQRSATGVGGRADTSPDEGEAARR
jgi:SnoaL-like domain